MEAKYDVCVCGHIRDHHQYYLTGGETAHSWRGASVQNLE